MKMLLFRRECAIAGIFNHMRQWVSAKEYGIFTLDFFSFTRQCNVCVKRTTDNVAQQRRSRFGAFNIFYFMKNGCVRKPVYCICNDSMQAEISNSISIRMSYGISLMRGKWYCGNDFWTSLTECSLYICVNWNVQSQTHIQTGGIGRQVEPKQSQQ